MLFDPAARSISYFSWLLPSDLILKIPSGSNPIHQLEVLPVLISFKIWREQLTGRGVIIFVDNEGAKSSLVNGGSGAEVSNRIVAAIDDAITAYASSVWYDRVPSAANPADAPSRGKVPSGRLGWQGPTETLIGPEVRAMAGCHLTFGPKRAV